MQQISQKPLIDLDLSCTFKKDQTVLIPLVVRKRVSFYSGIEVSVEYNSISREIILLRNDMNTLENQMIINKNGAIRIPAEIKHFSGLREGQSLDIALFDNLKGVVLRVSSK